MGYHNYVIVDFLEFDWPLNYKAVSCPTPVFKNHPSAMANASEAHKFISIEVQLNATAGPFSLNPLKCPLMVSPLLTIPKKNSSSRRVVMDLSFPHQHSVNDGIPKDIFLGEPF